MKPQLSTYDFIGILTPSTILLFFSDEILKTQMDISLFDYSQIRQSIVFLLIAYGIGQLLAFFGSYLEKLIWFFYSGQPTTWLTRPKSRNLGLGLYEQTALKSKLSEHFGLIEGIDFSDLIYTKLYQSDEHSTDRIDLFNANYALFRSLAIVFLFLSILILVAKLYIWLSVSVVCLIAAMNRMIRFGKAYAKELYISYLTYTP